MAWKLTDPNDALLLSWAADLHEIGMDISHSQYHKHGGYLLNNMDLPGFSRSDQSQLAAVLIGVLEDNDILLMQGAGDIGRLAKALAESENLEVLL